LNCSRTLWNVSKQAKGFRTLWKRNLDMMQTSQNVFGTLWNLFPKHIWLFSNKSMYEHFWNVHILNCSWIIWIVSKQIWMFRNTFEIFQMFRNTFQILPKYLFWNVSETLKKSKCFPIFFLKSQNVSQNNFEIIKARPVLYGSQTFRNKLLNNQQRETFRNLMDRGSS